VTLGGSFRCGAIVAIVVTGACAEGSEADLSFVVEPDAGAAEAGAREASAPLPGPDAAIPDAAVEDDAGACTRKLVINEVMTRGATAGVEFVELYNPNSCPVSVGGYRIRYKSSGNAPASGSTRHTIASGTSIAAKGFYVIGSAAFTGPKDATFDADSGIADDGQLALFEDGDDNVRVDAVAFGAVESGDYVEGSPAPRAAAGTTSLGSIARIPNGVDTDDNASDFAVAQAPTPGAPN
jgi:hypothetical protein